MNCLYLERSGKPNLAYHYTSPNEQGANLPTVVFLGGFKSDMNGTKANFLENACKEKGQAYLRFDYTGHGQSGGKFEDGTIGIWKQDALDIFDHLQIENALLIGSSMGGWLSLLLALERTENIHALIGIAAAPDFTNDLWFNRLNEEQRDIVLEKGYVETPNNYSDEPYIFTKALFDDGKSHFLLENENDLDIPMTLMQGMQDPDVPWETSVRIQKAFPKADIDIIFIDDGDHSLSRPEDLEMLNRELVSLSNRNNALNTL